MGLFSKKKKKTSPEIDEMADFLNVSVASTIPSKNTPAPKMLTKQQETIRKTTLTRQLSKSSFNSNSSDGKSSNMPIASVGNPPGRYGSLSSSPSIDSHQNRIHQQSPLVHKGHYFHTNQHGNHSNPSPSNTILNQNGYSSYPGYSNSPQPQNPQYYQHNHTQTHPNYQPQPNYQSQPNYPPQPNYQLQQPIPSRDFPPSQTTTSTTGSQFHYSSQSPSLFSSDSPASSFDPVIPFSTAPIVNPIFNESNTEAPPPPPPRTPSPSDDVAPKTQEEQIKILKLKRQQSFAARKAASFVQASRPIEKSKEIDFKSLTLDDIQPLIEIGRGSYGRVYISQLKSDPSALFALKLMNKAMILKAKAADHIFNEKHILQKLKFRYIVQLHRTFQDTENIYLLQEYCPGGNLLLYLKRMVKFPVETARFYAAQMLLALEYLHSLDIIWRDLKPENLMLDINGNIKFVDFGFAKQIINTDRTYSLVGTPQYIAPEIVQGKAHYKAADWWSFGIILFEFLSGYFPFSGGSPIDIYKAIINKKPSFPKHFDKDAKDLISKLLHKNPAKRLGSTFGAAELRQHKFFASFDFTRLERNELDPLIKPALSGPHDTSCHPLARQLAIRGVADLPILRQVDCSADRSWNLWKNFT